MYYTYVGTYVGAELVSTSSTFAKETEVVKGRLLLADGSNVVLDVRTGVFLVSRSYDDHGAVVDRVQGDHAEAMRQRFV